MTDFHKIIAAERDAYRDNAEQMNEAASRYLRRAEQAEKRLDQRQTELLEANNRLLQLARDAEAEHAEIAAERDRLKAEVERLNTLVELHKQNSKDCFEAAEKENDRLCAAMKIAEGALAFFEDADNWKREGKCDPNSGNFIGSTHARSALAAIQEALRQ